MAVTPNLGLHQWQSGDSFLREDFNEDFSKIDAMTCTITTGAYTGDGLAGRKITLGFRPKLLMLIGRNVTANGMALVAERAMAYLFGGNTSMTDYSTFLSLNNDGFTINKADFMNVSTETTVYVAFR